MLQTFEKIICFVLLFHFRTPPYRDTQIQDNVSVMMELVRPKDNSRSESMKFTYLPSSNRNREFI